MSGVDNLVPGGRVEVWLGGIACLISEGGGGIYSLLVGIEVSKDSFSAAGIGSEGNESFSKSYSMDSNGFQELVKTITFTGEVNWKEISIRKGTDFPKKRKILPKIRETDFNAGAFEIRQVLKTTTGLKVF